MATVLAKPPAAAASRAAPRDPSEGRNSRAFPVGLAVSAVLHLLLLGTITFHYTIQPAAPRRPLQGINVGEPAMQVYEIEAVSVGPGEPEPPPLPPRSEPVRSPVPAASVPGLPPLPSTDRPGPVTRGPSAAERLRRGYTDPQLLAPVDRLPPEELTEAEWLRLRLAGQLDMYNDSIAAEAAAKLRATDWTTTDKDGGRWGVSPGKIHLGNVTLPLPFGFSASPEKAAEMAARARSWNESQSQASRREAAETFEQRVKAIRERQQAARDSARRGGG
jgi:hypothetical protein